MAPMLLTELPDDKLLEIFKVLQNERTGATFVWKLVCKAMKHVAPEDAKSWLCAMGYSYDLVKLARSMGVTDDRLVLSMARSGKPEGLYAIRNEEWVTGTTLLNPGVSKRLFPAVVSSGNVKMVQLAATMGFCVSIKSAHSAAKMGLTDVFNWLLDVQSAKDTGVLNVSFDHPVEKGQVHTVDLDDPEEFEPIDFFEYHHEWSSELVRDAVTGGNLDIVKRVQREMIALKAQRINDGVDDEAEFAFDYEEVCTMAADDDHVHILTWAVEQLEQLPDDAPRGVYDALSPLTNGAAAAGSRKVLKWLHERLGDEFDPDEIYEVCDYDFEMVKWTLDELNVPPEYALMVAAVNHRAQPNYEMMEYLHAKGCPKDVPEGMHAQEEEDHLDVYQAAAWFQGPKAIKCIRWLHDRGYGIAGSRAVSIALRNDDLCVLGALLAIGFDFDEAYFDGDAFIHWSPHENWDQFDVVKWARENGFRVRRYPRTTPIIEVETTPDSDHLDASMD